MKRFLTLILLTLIVCSDLAVAQDRPAQSVLTAEWGKSAMRNTYLAPLLYEGRQIGVRYERWRTMRSYKWTNQQIIDADFADGDAENGQHSTSWSIRAMYRYAMHRDISHLLCSRCQGLTVLIGPYAGLETGFDYNLKLGSSNNPATARFVGNMGVSLASTYDYTLWGQPSKVNLQVQMPLIGYAFMPEYGASYYETFLIESGNNGHFTSLHNEQDLDVRLSTDIPIAVIPWFKRMKTIVRLGAYYHIETMDINSIVNRYSTFGISIGWTWKYLPL